MARDAVKVVLVGRLPNAPLHLVGTEGELGVGLLARAAFGGGTHVGLRMRGWGAFLAVAD